MKVTLAPPTSTPVGLFYLEGINHDNHPIFKVQYDEGKFTSGTIDGINRRLSDNGSWLRLNNYHAAGILDDAGYGVLKKGFYGGRRSKKNAS